MGSLLPGAHVERGRSTGNEITRLGGHYAHVHDESINTRHDEAAGEAWLHGCFSVPCTEGPRRPRRCRRKALPQAACDPFRLFRRLGFTVKRRHLRCRIAITRRRICRHGALDLLEIVAGQCQLHRAQRFRQAFPSSGADERHDVRTTREHPRNRHLSHCCVFRHGNAAQLLPRAEGCARCCRPRNADCGS